MSALSEECFCAGWMHRCEYSLWATLTGKEVMGYKVWQLSAEDVEELRLVHELADGWIIWPESLHEPSFLLTDKWLAYLDSLAQS